MIHFKASIICLEIDVLFVYYLCYVKVILYYQKQLIYYINTVLQNTSVSKLTDQYFETNLTNGLLVALSDTTYGMPEILTCIGSA